MAFSWTGCPLCKKAKALLSDLNGIIANNARQMFDQSCTMRALQVVVFSWTGCPFCKKAKALLSELKADYLAVELDTMGEEGKALRAELAKVNSRILSCSLSWLLRCLSCTQR